LLLAKQTHKPKSLACLVVFSFCRVSLAEYYYSDLLNLWFSGNPIWSGSIPDGWELEWENDVDE
jgi:hypothetical protein